MILEKLELQNKILLKTIISKSLNIFNQIPVVSDPKKNVVVIAADPESILISESASASYHSDGWNVSHLGDMSSAINVLFDLRFSKISWKNLETKTWYFVSSHIFSNFTRINFFADSINPNKKIWTNK